MAATSDVQVADAPARHRYEARVDGRLAGLSAYQLRDDVVRFTHTEVFDEYEGRGVGAALVRAALDDVRSRHLLVDPACPFVAAFIERHSDEYADLLSRRSTGGDGVEGDTELG